MTTPAFVRAYGVGDTTNKTSLTVTIDTTGLGANGAVVVYLVAGGSGHNMSTKVFSTPTIDGSTTGWSETIAETVNAASTSGMMGAWVCLNPASNATASLVVAWTTAVDVGDRLAVVAGLYTDVASVTAFTPDNDGGSTTSDTMTNAAGAGNLSVGAWAHGSAISSVTSGTTRGSILNASSEYCHGNIVFIEGDTIAFSSGSADSNLGMQIKLVGTGAAADAGFDQRLQRPPGLFSPTRLTATGDFSDTPSNPPQTVTAQVADLTLTAVAGTVTGNGATVTAQVASLTLTPVVGTLLEGGVTMTAQVATLTLTATASAPIAGVATVPAAVATLALTAIPGVPSGGATTVTAQVATITLTAIAGTKTGGPVTVTAQVGIVVLTAVPGSISGGAGSPQTVTAQVATLALTAVAGTLTEGNVTVTAQIATITLTAVAGTRSAGNATVTATTVTLTLTAVQGTLVAGPVTVTAQRGLLTLTAVPGTAFVGTLAVIVGRALYGTNPAPFKGSNPRPGYGRDAGVGRGRDPGVVFGRDPDPIGG